MFLFPLTPKKIEKWASQKKYDNIINVLSMDDKTALQAEAIKALTYAPGWYPGIVPKIIELYNKPELRKPLITLYGKYRETPILNKLLGLLEEDDEIRPEVIRSLGSIEKPSAVPALLARIGNTSEQELIVEAVRMIIKASGDYDLVLKEITADKPDSIMEPLCKTLVGLNNPHISKKLLEFVFTPNPELRKTIVEALKGDKQFDWADCLKGDEDDFKRLAENGNDYVFKLLMQLYEKGNRIIDQYPERIVFYYTRGSGDKYRDEFMSFAKKNRFEKAVPFIKQSLWTIDGKVRLEYARFISEMGVTDYQTIIKGETGDFIRLLKERHDEGIEVTRRVITTTSTYGPQKTTMINFIDELGKSGLPEAADILFYGFTDGYYKDQCFDALPPTMDEKIISGIMKMLVSYDDNVRIRAAEKLDQMGDHRWTECVKGNDSDIERLCMAGNPAALSHVSIHMGILDKKNREEAAKLMLRVFRNHPEYPLNWKEIIGKMKNPHEDSHTDNHCDSDRSSDCHCDEGESVHTDTGMSMSFLEEDLKNFTRIEYLELRKTNMVTEQYLIQQINENEKMLMEEMFVDAMQFSSVKMIEAMGRFSEKQHPLAPKAIEYMLNHREDALPYLAASLLTNRDERAIDALVSAGEKAYDLLIDLLQKNDKVENIIEVLGLIGDKRAVSHLKPFLTSQNGNNRMQTAMALAKLGEHEWMKIIKNDSGDFERLIEKCDPQFLNWYKENFRIDEYTNKQMLMAKTLAKLGEKELAAEIREMLIIPNCARGSIAKVMAQIDDKTSWEKVIKGDDGDFARIADVGDREAVKILMVFLKAPGKKDRSLAAEALIGMAKKDFSVIHDDWKEISAAIQQKHEDSSRHIDHWAATHSGDCHSDSTDHTDSGVGLVIPENIA